LRERTRHSVDGAAGIEGHHDLYRPVREIGAGEERKQQRGEYASKNLAE
jgi:hypothetical protein